MSWTDERVELLKKMWNEGHSASTIAKELGGVTRNAVIGKVHRLGLSNRNGPDSSSDKPEPASPAAPEKAPGVVDLAQVKAERAAQPKPKAAPAPQPEPAAAKAEPEVEEDPVPTYTPKPIIPAGQPLPPQPSANEIDPEALATVREVEKTAMKLSLLELTERTCKWPIGDPATSDFWFCGLPVKAGKPYCEAHVAVAFQPMSTRRDRKR
ncbi:GcrA family cell cycle regulator [Roseibaca sp. Y0-43]|uniref:GcrA family cell cycle regulator n=1 Tax=Roseibaca sp. Y0-43 TaxID=2816854 RepID=UPI001D0C6857|nr:GcrA family cell cycle regulator [Roseibaca sp. Y0-43]MCC1480759.1 GcrA cell cycle regulator [Roseibaca sp. Y0-43]